jgi:hypothetical protein
MVVNDEASAVHEYAHRLQSALPDLDGYFQELHQRRTTGDALKRLSTLSDLNYRADEMTREDNYVDPYFGKEYPPTNYSYHGRAGALELMTMAFEIILSGNEDFFYKFYREDKELFNLAIGLLFHYAP